VTQPDPSLALDTPSFHVHDDAHSLTQAAHGWMQSSPLVTSLGAFINLEAIGAGGVPLVFQHTGAWTVKAYARQGLKSD